jgi:putative aldouronate transport system permease protein
LKILKSVRENKGLKYFLIAIPFIIFTFMFSYVPIFGWFIAFTNYTIGSKLTALKWSGFQSFVTMWSMREDVLRVLVNSVVISGIGLLLSPLAMIFAILLNEIKGKKTKRFIQTATTFPNFISWVVVFGFAYSLFSNNGMVNTVLGQLGLPQSPTGILGDAEHVWTFQVCLGLWKTLGWNSIIYLATITGIDQQLYEAAEIDGANKFNCIRYITLPSLFPTFFVLLVLAISNILNNGFDQYFVFYNPLVAHKIEVFDYYTYKLAFLMNQMPVSVAVSMLKSIVSIILVFGANRASKAVRGESIF